MDPHEQKQGIMGNLLVCYHRQSEHVDSILKQTNLHFFVTAFKLV